MSKSRSIPEELIRIKAQKFWKKFQAEERDATPEDSRIDARHYLEKHRWEVWQWKLTKTLSRRPIKRFADWWETTPVEKFFLEDIKYLLENSAFISIVTLIAEITIIFSLVTWIAEKPERWEDEIFSTWQVVNDADQDQSGVVKLALERLLRNNFSLAGLELKNTNLIGAKLQKTNLRDANLQKADLFRANLQQTNLLRTNLQQTNLRDANLQKAALISANLQEAALISANLQEAVLISANLQEAVLIDTKDFTSKQIKQACFWEQAIYKGEWNSETQTYVVFEADNTKFIEKLKKDKSSDPKKQPDCSFWKR